MPLHGQQTIDGIGKILSPRICRQDDLENGRFSRERARENVALACSVVWRLVTYPPEINVADQTRCPVTAHEARSYDVTSEVEG